MYSFTHRPVGNSLSPGPQWKNKNGFLIARNRIAQLYYTWYIGRLRDPYQCGICKQYGHNGRSTLCKGPRSVRDSAVDNSMPAHFDDINELLDLPV